MNILVKNENQKILEKCEIKKEQVSEKPVLFTELGRDMFKGNEYILKTYFRNEHLRNCYFANLLSFRNIENISLYQIKKKLQKDFGFPISLKGYKYNPEHYRYEDAYTQIDYEENLYREQEDEPYNPYEGLNREMLDFEAYENLENQLINAIKLRIVIILNLDDVPALLNNAIDCQFKDVSCSQVNKQMHAKLEHLKRLLSDKEVFEWLKAGNNDLTNMHFETETYEKNKGYSTILLDMSSDYVNTYQKVLRQLTGIRNEPLEECRYILESEVSPSDPWIEEIIENNHYEEDYYTENVADENDECSSDNYLD